MKLKKKPMKVDKYILYYFSNVVILLFFCYKTPLCCSASVFILLLTINLFIIFIYKNGINILIAITLLAYIVFNTIILLLSHYNYHITCNSIIYCETIYLAVFKIIDIFIYHDGISISSFIISFILFLHEANKNRF